MENPIASYSGFGLSAHQTSVADNRGRSVVGNRGRSRHSLTSEPDH
ncbi:MAG: hypothetical protein WBA57_00005 [Elainellaceae cyanobacterium]